jgi:small subunit ribosomal protein S6
MRFYECTVILTPELSKQQIEEVQNELTDIVKSFGGETSRHEYWGMRPLAYPIKKSSRAHYIFFNISTTPEAIIELERKMNIREDVLRYLSIRVDALDFEPSIMMQSKQRDDTRKETFRKDDNFRKDKDDSFRKDKDTSRVA